MRSHVRARLALLAPLLALACKHAGPDRAPPIALDYAAHPPDSDSADGSQGQFFPGTTYDPSVPTPAKLLGHPLGARMAHHAAIVEAFRTWSDSPRVQLAPYATSYEGRELVRVAISSEANIARLDAIKADIAKLADPRGLDAAAADAIVAGTPAIAWLGYSIHGDEVSGADSSLAVGYHLIAGTSADVMSLLENVIVVIDPVMNPDGRERIVGQVEQARGQTPNLDYASMHRGRWPYGRGNHYLFDMNRDWIAGVAPETRGRWREHLAFHPQLVVDAHEMGGLDTYLFYPVSDPVNANIPPNVSKWHRAFADRHAAAFDAYGWAYYTREWADGWYAGYTDAWASLNGGIGILYEQAGIAGQPLKRPSGRVVTYRESVHGHAVSSLSDVRTLSENRREILSDYLAARRGAIDRSQQEVFALETGHVPDREHALVQLLMRQGIEIYRADAAFETRARGVLDPEPTRHRFEPGTFLIPVAQPQGALVRSLLEYDPRMPEPFLQDEREELERKGRSKIYDITAWNLVRLFDLRGAWIEGPKVARSRVTDLPATPGELQGNGKAYAWVVDGAEDRSTRFAARAMEHGIAIHVADERFTTDGVSHPRGSLLVRRHENPADVESRLQKAAREARIVVLATQSGRSTDEGPDLGGQHFHLLARPRVAVVANAPVRASDYGHIWHHLDVELGVPTTLIDAQEFGGYDLRRYNVLVLPPASGGLGGIVRDNVDRIQAWIRGGGTLVGIGSSAAMLTDPELGLSGVRRRRDVLDELDAFEDAAQRDLASRQVRFDPEKIWDATSSGGPDAKAKGQAAQTSGPDEEDAKTGSSPGGDEDALARADGWARRFSPQGAIVRGLVDGESYLTFGLGAQMPVLVAGDSVYLTRDPGSSPVRLAPPDSLRLGGLLWPEARARLARSAHVTVERLGSGQIVLFASSPVFRGVTRGTARIFSNTVIYGPALGARQPATW